MKKIVKKKILDYIGVDLEEHRVIQSFLNPHYQQHNVARLQHLESLKLDLDFKTVFEFGAGIGDHSLFYLFKNCRVIATDGRPELVDFIKKRLNIETMVLDAESQFSEIASMPKVDVIHCYGFLYHISNPLEFIQAIREKCDLLLLETCVCSDEKEPGPYVVNEVQAHLSQATSGKGCRPSRIWLDQVLRKNFKHVYYPKTQPKHHEFKTDWTKPLLDSGTNYVRCVFIASNSPISNDKLTDTLPKVYEPWGNLEYYSQYGQDRIIDDYLKRKVNGTFIEIGAYDGVKFSNTYFFEKNRNWKGVCVEPVPEQFEKLQKNRTSINVNACVYSTPGEVEFTKVEGYADMLSGVSKDYHEKHKSRIKENIKHKGGNQSHIKVKAVSLNELIESNKLKDIDYCSIDTEGSEYEVLSNFDFKKHNIKLFSIENNYADQRIRDLMKAHGYELLRTIECDEIYVLK